MVVEYRFRNRRHAGQRLAEILETERYRDAVVVGLPRGGIPVAAQVAAALHAPLDVIVVRKLGVPSNPEFGFGAIGEDGILVVDPEIVRQVGLSSGEIEGIAESESAVMAKRVAQIREVHPQIDVGDKTVIVVDDGIATGIDARAACRVARARGAKSVVFAVPVAPADWRERLQGEANQFVAVIESSELSAVGEFYDEFSAVPDDQMLSYLR